MNATRSQLPSGEDSRSQQHTDDQVPVEDSQLFVNQDIDEGLSPERVKVM